MNGIATMLAGTVVVLTMTVGGIGKAECISECLGSAGSSMHCTSCDSPKDGEIR